MVRTFKHLFTPHHSNNHRPRVLHPAGLVVMIGVFILFQIWVDTAKYALTSAPRGLVLGFASNIYSDQVLTLTNEERAKVDLPPLTLNGTLSEAARKKANHMFANNYWAHIAPDGTTPWSFITSSGYTYTVAGENLARDFGDTPSMVAAWMNSPTHRDNIINPKYSEIGVAVVDGILEGTETTLVVQMFGSQTTKTPQTTTVAARTNVSPPPSQKPTQPVKVTPGVTTLPTPLPTGEQIALLQAQTVIDRSDADATPPLSDTMLSPLSITKAVGAAILILLSLVLLYDERTAHRQRYARRVGKNWAHLVLFAVMLLMLNMISSGRVPVRGEGGSSYVTRP